MLEQEVQAGDLITGFNYILPVDASVCGGQIASALARGLPEALSRRRLHIIANGPTAPIAELGHIGPTLALNGAIKLFTDKGLAPDFWACCDPQPLIADYLPDNPPRSTVYYVASKCHPSIFDKLKGCDVRVWHLKDHPHEGRARVALASSITISASWLFHRLGFTDFEYYGWDGCFLDGKHHAHDSSDWSEWSPVPTIYINYSGKQVGDEVIGGQTFATTRTWAAEAKDAGTFFQFAQYFDIGIKIHGDGMFRCAHETLWAA